MSINTLTIVLFSILLRKMNMTLEIIKKIHAYTSQSPNINFNIFISLIRYDFQITALVPRRKLEIHEIKTLLVLQNDAQKYTRN